MTSFSYKIELFIKRGRLFNNSFNKLIYIRYIVYMTMETSNVMR